MKKEFHQENRASLCQSLAPGSLLPVSYTHLPYEAHMQDGYVVLDRTWKDHAIIEINWPCVLRYEAAPDRENYFVVFFGPYVLAALTGQEERLMLHAGNADEDFEREVSRPLACLLYTSPL